MSLVPAQFPFIRRTCLRAVVIVSALMAIAAPITAADEPLFLRESFSFNKDETAIRRLDDVREYIRTKRWDQAADLLIKLSDARGKSLVPMQPGWYVSVSRQCNLLAVSLPTDGRAAYRRKIDARAAKWLADGIRDHDEQLLQRIVREAFCSSSGDDALLRLGQWAWDVGQLDRARQYWSRMLPPDNSAEGDNPVLGELRYPDTNHDNAIIRARLILCDVIAGQTDRAISALATFRKQHPATTGRIAGREGRLAETLATVLKDAKSWKRRDAVTSWPTFGGVPKRQRMLDGGLEIGRPRWSQAIPSSKIPETNAGQLPRHRDPTAFPVVTGGRVYFTDAGRVLGFELRDGSPAFFVKNGENPASILERATLYSNGDVAPFLPPSDRTSGTPWFTATAHDGRLYARLGSPITGRTNTEQRAERSSLVSLDLEHGEGKLAWKIESRKLGAGWEFEGAPVVSGDRLYVVLRRRNPETEIHVACFDAKRGNRLWTTSVGSAIAAGEESVNHISQLLLTLSAGRLFLSTDVGALVSLDEQDGFVEWIVTYHSRNADRKAKTPVLGDSQLTPCLVHDGLLFAAPSDSNQLLTVDARTGQPLWQRKLRGGVRHLLGISHGRLIVSGQRLWGLDPKRGTIDWNIGYEDPAGFGFGRGLLAGRQIYWPLRKEVLVVDVQSGRMEDRIRLQAAFGRGGGNLIYVNGTLLIAEPHRLTAYNAELASSKPD